MPFTCPNPAQNSGNDTYNIPVKDGAPLSSACERSSTKGSIPEVIRHPAFTLVAGGTVQNRVSNGGIQNMSSFFKSRNGCYRDKDAYHTAATCL